MGLRAETALRLRQNHLAGGLRASATLLLAGLLLAVSALSAEAARLVSAAGNQPDGYGRLILTFDAPVVVKAKLSGAVLVLAFGESVSQGPERIVAGMPDYVSVARRDPDGSALRLALQRNYRINLQEAGEQVFIDLLPESWSGLPPQLPPEVVAALAKRAREAEAQLRARNPLPVPKVLPLEVAYAPRRASLSLRLPPEAKPVFERVDGTTRMTLAGAWRIDERAARGRLKSEFGKLRVENDGEGARLIATPAAGIAIEGSQDDELAVIVFTAPEPAADKKPAIAEAKEPAAAVPEPAAANSAPIAEPARSQEMQAPASAPLRRAGGGLVFAFAKPTPAALFERGGVATLVFETSEPITLPATGDAGLIALGPPRQVGNFAVLRFSVPVGHLYDLLAVGDPTGWELVGGDAMSPSESLVAQRVAGRGARQSIAVKLPQPGSATWLDLDGERIAVVTSGPARAGFSKSQLFVDFSLLQSRHGMAVLALADDLAVRPDLDGVTIDREGGMALSGLPRPIEPAVAEVGELAIERDAWDAARRGDIRSLLRDKFAKAADSNRNDRSAARLELVRAMMANGLDSEATGVLGTAIADDPVLDGDPKTVLLRGILAARLGHFDEAETLLAAERLARNPEARLWRGFVHAASGRWSAADAALNAGKGVIDRYPDDLAAAMSVAQAQVAVELGDWEGAVRLIRAPPAGASKLQRETLRLLRARVDEAKGGHAAALEAFETLAQEAERPVAAAASLQATLLAHAAHKIANAEAIDRLETLALTWHGGPVESETLVALGRLYADMSRWRQVFAVARRANAVAPNSVTTRQLHESAQNLFEDLFLGGRAGAIGGVEALALYFDFKDFAPAGRRADEIVRRLSDRLVELDLLESAEELLQHQVAHRLTGTARAAVAARLATIQLMEGKPLEALSSLDATHLPELGEDLRRARALLRARALSDLTRTDLALETIEGEKGGDAERLRADILWAARRWREAGEAHETMLGETWRNGRPLDEAARADVIRAGIAYGLAGESLGLERLKAKFAGAMASGPDARTFTLLTRSDAVRNPAFREIARRATTAETLGAFLAEYRKRYPDAAVPERGKETSAASAQTAATPPG